MAASLSSTRMVARSPQKGWRARLRAALQLRWLRFLIAVVLASVFTLWAHQGQARWLHFIDNLVLDQGFRFRSVAEPPNEMEKSNAHADKFNPSDIVIITLPHAVPRPLLGQILRRTKAAKAVAIDMMLSDRARELRPDELEFSIYQKLLKEWQAEDAALAEDIRYNGNVILGQWPEDNRDDEKLGDEENEDVNRAVDATDAREPIVWQKPPRVLWDSAKYHASFRVEPDIQDGKIRTLKPFQETFDGEKTERLPALGVAAAAAKLGISPEKLSKTQVSNDMMVFGDRPVPLQNGLLTINYLSDRSYFEKSGATNNYVYYLALGMLDENDPGMKDKIVFIGETSFKSKDIFTTPLGDMPGVHIHAHTVMTLLDNRGTPRPVSTGWAALLGIAASLLLVIPLLRWPAWTVLALGLLEIVLIVIGAAFLFSLYNALLPASIPVAIVALSVASFTVLEHAFMRSALGRFVGEDALPRVSGTFGRLEPGGDEDDTAAFICDLRGFSTLSQDLPPKEAGILVSEYAGVIIEAVWPYGGHVADFAGDGALVIFPRGWVGDDYIWKATQAAVALREQMDKWQDDWTERGWGEVRFGVGLHSDRAWVGLIGVEKLLKVGAAGDAINVASRVQSLSKNTDHDILITEPVYQAIRGKIDAVSLGEKELTGRHGTIPVYGLHELLISSRPLG